MEAAIAAAVKAVKAASEQHGKEQATNSSKTETKGLDDWVTLRDVLQQRIAKKSAGSKSSGSKSAKNKPANGKGEGEGQSAAKTDKTTVKTEKTVPKAEKKGAAPRSAKASKDKAKQQLDVKTVLPGQTGLKPIDEETPQIPSLSYGLDRVLFNEGVYRMQDPRTLVYNFDPYLASIMPAEEFDFDALKEYITSSKDTKLRDLSKKLGTKYSGSTSSMTSILSHLHYLISDWRRPKFDQISRSWTPESESFTQLNRSPAATFLKYHDGVYSIDSDKQYDNENILSMLGKSMEKLLTLPKEEFEKYKKTRSHQLTEEEKNADEAYHYTTFGDFLMRSQLDAHDPRLPGTGVFDLKTRAVVTIRMDVQEHEKGVGYEIRHRIGQWESFEREYYDLIRSAFLKYSLQVRMGRMDGIFVAYHNTERIFGFQYISLEEMDQAIHGQSDTTLGDQEFKASLTILNDLLDRATKRFPGRTLRLHVETRPTKTPMTYFFVEPVTDVQMNAIQESGKTAVEQLKEDIEDMSRQEEAAETVGAEAEAATTQDVTTEAATTEQEKSEDETAETPEEAEMDQALQNEEAWREVMERVNEAVESESLGVPSVREAVQEALSHSGLLEGKTETECEKHVDALAAALTEHSRESTALQSAAEPTSSEAQNGDDETSLKDLILRVTKGIDENTSNINEFQRMFAGLADKSALDAEEDAASETEEGAAASEETSADDAKEEAEKPGSKPKEVLGMYVTIRNLVNGKGVNRPQNFSAENDWQIQYSVTEIEGEKALRLYKQIKQRRRKIFVLDAKARSLSWHSMFKGSLAQLSKKGRSYRAATAAQEKDGGIRVAWEKTPSP